MRLFGKVDGKIDSRDGAAILTPPFDMSVSGGSTTPFPNNIGSIVCPTVSTIGVSADRVVEVDEMLSRFIDIPTLHAPVTVEITSPYANSDICDRLTPRRRLG